MFDRQEGLSLPSSCLRLGSSVLVHLGFDRPVRLLFTPDRTLEPVYNLGIDTNLPAPIADACRYVLDDDEASVVIEAVAD